MPIQYKAEIGIDRYSRSGWDEYNDHSRLTLTDDSLEGLDVQIKLILERNNLPDSKGDFGIVLGSTTYSLLRKYKSMESDI